MGAGPASATGSSHSRRGQRAARRGCRYRIGVRNDANAAPAVRQAVGRQGGARSPVRPVATAVAGLQPAVESDLVVCDGVDCVGLERVVVPVQTDAVDTVTDDEIRLDGGL